MLFPLYTQIQNAMYTNSPLPLDDDDEQQIIQEIQTMNEHEHEIIYALIRMYFVEHTTDTNTVSIPYHGKVLKKHVKFDIKHFPDELKGILFSFIRIHQNSKQP